MTTNGQDADTSVATLFHPCQQKWLLGVLVAFETSAEKPPSPATTLFQYTPSHARRDELPKVSRVTVLCTPPYRVCLFFGPFFFVNFDGGWSHVFSETSPT